MKEQWNTKYKTTLCRNFEKKGVCPYKKKCQFAHGRRELLTQTRSNDFLEWDDGKIPYWIVKDVERLLS